MTMYFSSSPSMEHFSPQPWSTSLHKRDALLTTNVEHFSPQPWCTSHHKHGALLSTTLVHFSPQTWSTSLHKHFSYHYDTHLGASYYLILLTPSCSFSGGFVDSPSKSLIWIIVGLYLRGCISLSDSILHQLELLMAEVMNSHWQISLKIIKALIPFVGFLRYKRDIDIIY